MTTQPTHQPMDTPAPINIVFDGPPGPEGPRFIEVETDDGRSIRIGEWQERQDGNWVLRIATLQSFRTAQDGCVDVDPEQDLLQRILKECVNTDLSATHAVGVLDAARTLMLSKSYDLSPCEKEDE